MNPKRWSINRQAGNNRLNFSEDAVYNALVRETTMRGRFPNTERLSVVAAVIMLAYALNRFIEIPAWTIDSKFQVYSWNLK